MTKLPTESWDIKGVEVDEEHPEYKVGPTCSVPGCTRLADHAHHIVRRSFLAGDYKWVLMPDGVEIGNLSALCFNHHNEVTDNQSEITYSSGVFLWASNDSAEVSPLKPQPPRRDVLPITEKKVVENLGVGHVLADGHDRATCPTCKRPLPRPKVDNPMEEKKVRATWAVGVPVDAREDGADTLDALLEAARDEMAKKGWEYGDASTAKFFVLSHALSMFVMHSDQILADS